MSKEAIKLALGKIKSARDCHFAAIDTLLFEAEEILEKALAEQPAQQERTDYAVHLSHCNIGECEGVCKYLDDDCPALKHADMKAKWDSPSPQPAQRKPLTVHEIAEFVGTHEYGPEQLKWFRLGEAANIIKENT